MVEIHRRWRFSATARVSPELAPDSGFSCVYGPQTCKREEWRLAEFLRSVSEDHPPVQALHYLPVFVNRPSL